MGRSRIILSARHALLRLFRWRIQASPEYQSEEQLSSTKRGVVLSLIFFCNDLFSHLLGNPLMIRDCGVVHNLSGPMRWMFLAVGLLSSGLSNAQTRESLLNQGKYELSRERYTSAISLLNKVIEIFPADPEAYFLRGVSKYELEDLIGAESDFSRSIEENSENQDVFLYRAVCRSQLFRFKKAFEDYNRAIETDKTDWRIYSNRALASLFLENFVDAISDCNRVLELKANDAYTYLIRGEAKAGLEMYHVAIDDLEHAMKLDSTDMRPYLERGIVHGRLEDYPAAISDFDRARRMEPANYLPLYHRGLTYMAQGQFDLALKDFDEVIVHHPDNATTYFNRALLWEQMERTEEALADYAEVQRLNPKNILTYLNRGDLYFRSSKFQAALTDYDLAIELFPDFYEAYEKRAAVFEQLNDRKNYDENLKRMQGIRKKFNGSDGHLKLEQHAKLMRLTALKGDFEPQKPNVGKIQYKAVDIRLIPFYRITPFPDLNTALKAYDGYGKPHYDTGIIALIDHADEASSTFPGPAPDSPGILNAALRLGVQGRYHQAYAAIQKLLDADSALVTAYFLRASLRQAQLEQAQKDLLRSDGPISAQQYAALRLSTDSVAALAEADYRRVIALDSRMIYAYFNLGNLLSSTEQYAEAEYQYGHAISLSEDFAEASYNRGLIRILLSNTSGGCADLSRAGQLGLKDAYSIIKRFCE